MRIAPHGWRLAAGFVRRWPISSFYILTLAVSWPFGLLPVGPSLAAIPCAALIDGRVGLADLFNRVIRWRVGVGWYLVALLGPVALVFLAAGINVMLGAELKVSSSLFDMPEMGRLFLLQIVGVFAGAWEELGWRGYALPRLLQKSSPLAASLFVGSLWAAWHIPLFISGDVPWADAAWIIPVSVLFTAVFVRTDQSVLIAFLLHAAFNAAGGLAIPAFSGSDRVQMYWSLAGVTFAVVALVVGLRPGWWLHRGAGAVSASAPEPAPDRRTDVHHETRGIWIKR